MMDFHAIYRAYPRHREPRTALRAIEKAHKRLCDGGEARPSELSGDCYLEILVSLRAWAYDLLLQKTRQFAASPEGRKEEKFIPYPATWFNASSYLEDPAEWGIKPQQKRDETPDMTPEEIERVRARIQTKRQEIISAADAVRNKREAEWNLKRLGDKTRMPV